MLVTDAAILITGLGPSSCEPIVRTLRSYLGAGASGVTARIAVRRGIVAGCVTLSDHDPSEGVGTMPWMIANERLGAVLARALKTTVSIVLSERRTSWEQIQSFNRGGQSHGAIQQASLGEVAERFEKGGLDPRYAAAALPLGLQAWTSGLRRTHLEDLIDETRGLTWPLAGDAVPSATDLDATLGELAADLDPAPHGLELRLPSALFDDLAGLGRKLRAKEPDVVEAVWRIAIRKKLFAAITDPEGVCLRPFERFGVLRYPRVQAAWSTEPLPSSDPRAGSLQIPKRVIWELHELASHADRPVSWVFERAYHHARAV